MDDNPLSYAYTLEGEHAQRAEGHRRKAAELRREAESLDRLANMEQERAAWCAALAKSMEAQGEAPEPEPGCPRCHGPVVIQKGDRVCQRCHQVVPV